MSLGIQCLCYVNATKWSFMSKLERKLCASLSPVMRSYVDSNVDVYKAENFVPPAHTAHSTHLHSDFYLSVLFPIRSHHTTPLHSTRLLSPFDLNFIWCSVLTCNRFFSLSSVFSEFALSCRFNNKVGDVF